MLLEMTVKLSHILASFFWSAIHLVMEENNLDIITKRPVPFTGRYLCHLNVMQPKTEPFSKIDGLFSSKSPSPNPNPQ